MKTLILYASTYGYTTEVVNKMVEESNNKFDSINIRDNKTIDLTKYDAIILGSSIYVGQIDKELKNFIQVNLEDLMSKRLGIFLCCGFSDQFDTHLKNNFTEDFIQHATKVVNFGGMIQKDKLKFGHKVLVSMIEKTEEGKKPIQMYQERTIDLVKQFN